jgi:sulfide dehydrogenase [flavocytochrome c] flavoprotein subunit
VIVRSTVRHLSAGKHAFSKQRLFLNAWKELYPDMLEWVPLSKGDAVTEVDPTTKTFITDFGKHQASVGNVIPPQKAGRIAEIADVADRTGWCPIDPVTFESKLVPNIHVVGPGVRGNAPAASAGPPWPASRRASR